MTNHSVISAAPQPCGANSRFADQFGLPLPRGLREQADEMSWENFVAAYGPSTGPVRLGQWACTDADRPATRLGPRPRTYQATIAVGDRIDTSMAAASGPLAALTAMLHERGIPVEMLGFHQFGCGDQTATCIYGSDGHRAQWAMGFSTDPVQSALDAVITCANRLLTAV